MIGVDWIRFTCNQTIARGLDLALICFVFCMLDIFLVRNELSHMLGRRTCVVSQIFMGLIVTCFIPSWDGVEFYLSFSPFLL